MNAYTKNDQFRQGNKQIVRLDARVPYELPALTVMGKVEHLTALVLSGQPDRLGRRNLL